MTTARARKRAPELMLRRPLSLGRKTACLLGGNAFLGRARVAALGDARRLAGTAAQVIELGATHRALADHFDAVDVRRIEREDALDALTERNLADSEVAAHALVRPRDAHALVILHAGACAFDHLDADLQRIAGTEIGNILRFVELGDVLRLDRLDEVHLIRPSYVAARQRETGPEHPHGAPKGPASVTVYLPRPALYARPRSSHDPPIAALRGSCALPTLEVVYNAGIRAIPFRSSRPHRWKARPLRREAAECKRRAAPARPSRRPTGYSRRSRLVRPAALRRFARRTPRTGRTGCSRPGRLRADECGPASAARHVASSPGSGGHLPRCRSPPRARLRGAPSLPRHRLARRRPSDACRSRNRGC